ncbi:MBL fold metallo-hydrolase [Marinicrinis lubricantis]|uniref:MBL fold metallo-hydrolase n=1 Tax=Marinicrinis lubricantis TaxID=2086470 RepID=A0ABW1IQE7_9BACL
MKISQYPYLYQLSFMPRLFPVNCYLVEEQEELTLIDAALPYSSKAILKTAREIGKPITRIVLTHAHDDHIGALDRLKEELPDAKVFISRRDSKLLQGDTALEPEEPQKPIKGGVPKRVKTRPDVLLSDGDAVGSLKAVACPGHTPGSMAFYDERSGCLIVGDAFQTRGGIAVSGKMKAMFPFPAMATWDPAASVRSAKKLAKRAPALLAVGHGAVLMNPLAQMEQAITEAEQALGKGQ